MQKAPEVQERIKAIRAAAPHTQEQLHAHLQYHMAVLNELAKSKWVNVDALPPEEAQLAQTLALLQKIETGNATASEIEEFRRLAGEIQRNLDPGCSVEFKKRIGSALSLVERF